MPDPAVSVIIPTYNRADLLRFALSSVIEQTLPPTEIVVVDDGSTDHTPEVVQRFKREGAPIVYLETEHANRRGMLRNKGAAAATSPLVAFLDSDDLWNPRRLELQVEGLERDPQAGFAFCNFQRFDANGPIEGPCLPPGDDYNGNILGELIREPLVISSTLLARRDAYEAVGGFADIRMNEDHELSLRLAARYPASYRPEVLVLMREHEDRTSRQNDEMPLLDYVHIIRRFLAEHKELTPEIKARGRQGIANVHFKLAKLYLAKGDKRAARRHLAALARLRPWDRRALPLYVSSLMPFTTPGSKRG